MPLRQTIPIYLTAGDPRGIRVAEITTRMIRMIEMSRSQLTGFRKLHETNRGNIDAQPVVARATQ